VDPLWITLAVRSHRSVDNGTPFPPYPRSAAARGSPAAAPWRPPPRCRPPPQLKPQALSPASCRSLARLRPRASSPFLPRPPAAPSRELAPSRLSKAPPSLTRTRIRNTKMTTTTVWWTWTPWRTRRAAPPPTSPSASPVSFTSVSGSYRPGPFRFLLAQCEVNCKICARHWCAAPG
jgi:hypothetical protein